MAEEKQQITKEPQEPQRVTKEVQRVTTKNPKKVEAGKMLAESNRKKREVKKREQVKLEASRLNQYYGIRAVIALGAVVLVITFIELRKESNHNKTILNHTLKRNHRPTSLR